MDVINGKGAQDVPAAVYEALFATVFHWDLDKIRNLSLKDFQTFAPMVDILFRKSLEKGL